ncbi:peptidoglycan D,D-transpeptidase FtsI family protein [Microbacteriaceae bacterium 4G12]
MKWKKRTVGILIFFSLMMLVLIGRLMQIQLVSTESFTDKHINLLEKSVMQRTHSVVLDDGRGHFVDRHGEPLSDDSSPSLILFPFLKNMKWPAQQVAAILQVKEQELLEQVEHSTTPFLFEHEAKVLRLTQKQVDDVNKIGVPGIVAANARLKDEHILAEHLVGITGQNAKEIEKRYQDKLQEGKITVASPIGISGLQRSFDEFLLTDGEAKLLYHVDRQGEPIFGKNVKYTHPANPFYPVSIQTTIQKALQTKAEELLKQFPIEKGGLVLLDVKTSEILAMASLPSLRTASYEEAARNQMLTPGFPGSVFKTVIAAAAIDQGLLTQGRMFDCNTNPYGEESAEHPMGSLSFTDSFARSCNRTFADIGQELMKKDRNIFEKYAKLLGMDGTVGWKGDVFHFTNFHQLYQEGEGTIWAGEKDKTVRKAIAQTSIGQKDVKLSPLAVANMMATIARGGQALEVKAVREITYKNGTKLYHFPEHKLPQTMKKETVQQLGGLLRQVVTAPNGTGAMFQTLPLAVAGKSGTAQTGKDNRLNHWFAGYFPYDNPRYALVVVDLETAKPSSPTKQIFAEYVKAIAAWEQEAQR